MCKFIEESQSTTFSLKTVSQSNQINLNMCLHYICILGFKISKQQKTVYPYSQSSQESKSEKFTQATISSASLLRHQSHLFAKQLSIVLDEVKATRRETNVTPIKFGHICVFVCGYERQFENTMNRVNVNVLYILSREGNRIFRNWYWKPLFKSSKLSE